MENNTSSVKGKIIEVIPSILDLKFGCEVYLKEYDENGSYVVLCEAGICNRHKSTHEGCYKNDGKCHVDDGYLLLDSSDEGYRTFTVTADKIGEILGRPIRLADVLAAIAHKEEKAPKGLFYVDSSGWFWRDGGIGNTTLELGEKWNLRDDDLEKQTPECINFLANLLK